MQEEAATFTIFVAAFLDLLAQSLPRVFQMLGSFLASGRMPRDVMKAW
jgi:hypothetical protein